MVVSAMVVMVVIMDVDTTARERLKQLLSQQLNQDTSPEDMDLEDMVVMELDIEDMDMDMDSMEREMLRLNQDTLEAITVTEDMAMVLDIEDMAMDMDSMARGMLKLKQASCTEVMEVIMEEDIMEVMDMVDMVIMVKNYSECLGEYLIIIGYLTKQD